MWAAICSARSRDINVFLNTSFDQPDQQEQSAYKRWRTRVAAYQAMLFKAGFEAPSNQRVFFDANQKVRDAVSQEAGIALKNPTSGLTLNEALEWFLNARAANRNSQLKSSSGKAWLAEGGARKTELRVCVDDWPAENRPSRRSREPHRSISTDKQDLRHRR